MSALSMSQIIPLVLGILLAWARPVVFAATAPFTVPASQSSVVTVPTEAEMLYPGVASLIGFEDFRAMRPEHRRMLAGLAGWRQGDPLPPAFCFSGPLPPGQAEAFNKAVMRDPAFQQAGRWTSTATNGPISGQGRPITLTYSFVPDGTVVSGGGTANPELSTLFATFDAGFGSTAAWQNLYHQVFARWGELCGITFVYEPNDDGVDLTSAPGVLGVRGDVRISAKYIDGSAGANVLAYNYYPNNGDMVMDSANIGYFASPNDNFRRLRNVIAHEHGHGMGQQHVCPDNDTKLMEPNITTRFDGPQHDDIQNAQRHYGDVMEENDTPAAAHPLGMLPDGTVRYDTLSIDDDSDVDWFGVQVGPSRRLTVAAVPFGYTYPTGPQTDACDSGPGYDSLHVHNLSISVTNADGSVPLAAINDGGLGEPELLQGLLLDAQGGTYLIGIAGGPANSIQIYDLMLTITDADAPTPTPFPTPTPAPTPGPVADLCADIIDICPGAYAGTTSGAGGEVSSACGSSGGAPDVWYRFTTAAEGVVSVSLCGSSFDTVLGLYLSCPAGTGAGQALICEDDSSPPCPTSPLASFFSINLPADVTIYLRVSGSGGASGDFILSLDAPGCGTPPPTPSPTDTPTPTPTETDTPVPSETATASPTPAYVGRAVGDFDDSRCTDLDDFLFLLDNWQLDLDGTPVGVDDFLALLDNWLAGESCL